MKTINKFFATTLSVATILFAGITAEAQTSGALFNEIAHQDSLQFRAFNNRNVNELMNYFDNNLELYQDNTGVRNFEQTKEAFGGLFKMSYALTRKLILVQWRFIL